MCGRGGTEDPKAAQRNLLSQLVGAPKTGQEGQAYLKGVSTCKVDALVKELGLTGIDKNKLSRFCKELDYMVDQFYNRPLRENYPYMWLDALYVKVVQNHR